MTERLPPNERPKVSDYMTGAGKDPWACPRCGCRGPHKVVNSYDAGGERRRRRICRNCGQGLIRTAEVPVPDGHKLQVVPEDDEERACA